jgi:hypothetical protein
VDPGYTASYSADCTGSIALGESKTCTITNDDNVSSLTVIKHVINDNGGTKSAAEFAITVAGNSPSPANFQGAEAPGTAVAIGPGQYSVTEAEDADYAASYSADCTGSIALGESKTCTITNDDKAASLTVVKHVVNDNGGTKVASDFAITVAGNGPSPANFPGAENPGTSVGIGPGVYNVTEVVDPGYTASYSADCTGSIALGESKTCTITNDDNAPKLTLVKEVVNDNGGTALPSAWTLTADGPTGFSGLGPSVSSGAGFDQGSYNLSEAGPAGYDASDWNCTGESNVDADTVSVGLGDDITCTITNDDQQASLTVVKHVVNSSGGTKTPANFAITINGVIAIGGNTFAGSSAGVTRTITTFGAYTVTEAPLTGYAMTSSSAGCTGTIQPGQDKLCVIVNDDVPATLTVVKQVVNNSGGTKSASDFTITINGVTALGGNTFAGSAAGVTRALASVGAYSVTEVAIAGYALQAASADCAGTIALGEHRTCVLTNNDA